MGSKKPQNIEEYKKWLKDEHSVDNLTREKNRYENVVEKIRSDFSKSDFWQALIKTCPSYDQEYLLKTHYHLFVGPIGPTHPPNVITKPFNSFLLKTFRKNVLFNRNWPNAPTDGWILPHNWFSRVNDLVRTLFVIKYLDGVDFLLESASQCFSDYELKPEIHREAREEGYYAVHLYIKQQFEIPNPTWDTEIIDATIELQITTQLQEVIRALLHEHYEKRRISVKSDTKWQWDYRSEEFAANYLGHILHYLEGVILEIRDHKSTKEGK